MGAPEEMSLPLASSPSLVLAHPTSAERRRTWTLTHPKWGTALSLDEYLRREEYLMTVPLAKAGGITHWVLTIRSMPPDERPILSSCESLRKRALFTNESGEVEEGVAHGVGSVFTDEAYRGKGYASRMLTMVRDELKAHQGPRMEGDADPEKLPPVAFSFLFSDIGKKFYGNRGWAPHRSSHLSFSPLPADAPNGTPSPSHRAVGVGYHELAELCAADEALLKHRMSNPRPHHTAQTLPTAPDPAAPLTRVALPPDLDTMMWHLMREDFLTTRLLGSIPSARGAVFGDKGRRIWAVWTRTYQVAPPDTTDNTLYILRLVVEDEDVSEEYLAEGLQALVGFARREAGEWGTSAVKMWNPEGRVEALMRKVGMEFEVVERQMDSIPSLMWYGDGPAENVVWVAGEKYTWC